MVDGTIWQTSSNPLSSRTKFCVVRTKGFDGIIAIFATKRVNIVGTMVICCARAGGRNFVFHLFFCLDSALPNSPISFGSENRGGGNRDVLWLTVLIYSV